MKVAGLPSPVELGFPTKFSEWYSDQIVAIDKAVLTSKRFTALAMPTGSGKSVTGIASALLKAGVERALYLTSTKGLQDQLAADFQELGLFDVRGQRNYPCEAIRPGGELDRYRRGKWDTGCDAGPCHAGVRCSFAPDRKEPSVRPDCTYYGAVFDARRAPLVSTNYAMWLAASTYSEGLGRFDCLVLDEAHDADKELESFLTFDIELDDAHYLGTKLLKTQDVGDWKDWATFHKSGLARQIEIRELMPPTDSEGAQDLRRAKMILGKLQQLSEIDPLSWILDLDTMRARFAPRNVSAYAEKYLFRGTPHVLLMSATMTRKTAALLGIPSDQLTYWECPSRFPVERRPVICINTYPPVRVTGRMSEDDKYNWLRRVDRFIEPRLNLNRKGIIHTVSYQRMKELVANSDFKDWMIVHDSGNTREKIREFKEAIGPYILVSPSIITGHDFSDDFARYNIIGKVPIPDMRGPIMSVRGELDPDYMGYLATVKLIQACGRINRNPLDWGETAIMDDTFSDWFLKKYRKFCPRWFLDAICYTETFPEPIHF